MLSGPVSQSRPGTRGGRTTSPSCSRPSRSSTSSRRLPWAGQRLHELLTAEPALAEAWSADGFTALHLAAYFGHVEGVRLLLEHGAAPRAVARNALEVQPLNSAAASQVVEARAPIARLLLEAGADSNAEIEGGFRPLDAAMQNDDAELVELLREHGAIVGDHEG